MLASKDSIGKVLKSIVQLGGQRVEAGHDHGVEMVAQRLLSHVHVEAVAKGAHNARRIGEARGHRGAGYEDLDQRQYAIVVFARSEKATQKQGLVVLEHLAVRPSHDLKKEDQNTPPFETSTSSPRQTLGST